MKKCILLILGCITAGIVLADVSGPDWETTDEGAVHAEWMDWSAFTAGVYYGPDYYSSVNASGQLTETVYENTYADAYSEGASEYIYDSQDGSEWLQINSDWDFSLWVTTLGGFEVQEVYFTITYWDSLDDSDWRQSWDFGLSTVGEGSSVQANYTLVDESHDSDAGLITEAYAFTIADSAEGIFIDFAGNFGEEFGAITSITVDSVSYDAVPEPASAVSVLLGGAILLIRKRLEKHVFG